MLFKKKDALALAEREAAVALSSFQSAKDGLESANARLTQIKTDAVATAERIQAEAAAAIERHMTQHDAAHTAQTGNAKVIAKLDDLLGL